MRNALLIAALVAAGIVGCACGILNFGGTNEDGTPKTTADARLFLRAGIDASVQVWGTRALREKNPTLLAAIDGNKDGVLELAEIEALINLDDPASLTRTMVLAALLFENKPQ